jgi:hypothetical protein
MGRKAITPMNHFDTLNIQVQLASLSITLAASSTYEQSQRGKIIALGVQPQR